MPEVKILIVMSYFIIFGTLSLVNIGVGIDENEAFLDDVFKYASCQLGGYNPLCEDIRRQFEKHLYPKLNVVAFLSFGLLSWVYIFTVCCTSSRY